MKGRQGIRGKILVLAGRGAVFCSNGNLAIGEENNQRL